MDSMTPPDPLAASGGGRDARLRSVFTNEVIRAIGALARQQNVCREQGGKVAFVTGMEAAREYIIEHVREAEARHSTVDGGSVEPAETDVPIPTDRLTAKCNCDPLPCRSCGKTLVDCYFSPRYKGRLNCCEDCNHLSRAMVAQEAAEKVLRDQAIEKLTDAERRALGV